MTLTAKIGFGGKVTGEVSVMPKLEHELGSRDVGSDASGKIIILSQAPTREFLEKAKFMGVSGVVAPEIHYRDFNYFRDEGQFAMMVIQKFGSGELSKETFEKIGKASGKQAQLDGETHELKIS